MARYVLLVGGSASPQEVLGVVANALGWGAPNIIQNKGAWGISGELFEIWAAPASDFDRELSREATGIVANTDVSFWIGKGADMARVYNGMAVASVAVADVFSCGVAMIANGDTVLLVVNEGELRVNSSSGFVQYGVLSSFGRKPSICTLPSL
ncbi:hypothetical protein HV824_11650 [Myxococcus sp. AM009]|uniref:SitI3 family protein n=1 Tax=Myxococcus sp. AM009 TaxID=2745137 RepID=UPI001595A27B|nr:SitI3 family protein [Myxococcus sp. AM009]NVI98771.1 hypothetical protein [Myxococcus sp. AM009]